MKKDFNIQKNKEEREDYIRDPASFIRKHKPSPEEVKEFEDSMKGSTVPGVAKK